MSDTIIYGITTEEFVITVSALMLILWRISYGYRKGLIAEALGLISVAAAFAVAYYAFGVVQNLKTFHPGEIPAKVISIIIAFIVYRVLHSLAESIRHLHEVPVIGYTDSILGCLVGLAEACLLIWLFQFVTGMDVRETALNVMNKLITNI
ncbi:MAG: CvpA family protein [Butyrivibrio sp.]|jgi:uncharacterized membrane protein required for colicin V production|nr:CvpA family protein [Butyrivibrio sp.]